MRQVIEADRSIRPILHRVLSGNDIFHYGFENEVLQENEVS